MEHYGMVCMFKTLENTGLKGLLNATGSAYENVVVEFFAKAKVIAGTIGDEDGVSIAARYCGKGIVGSSDMVTSENFDLMVAISAGLKVNWSQVLFQVLVNMVNNPTRQSQGFAVQINVLLQNLVQPDLGDLVKLHPQKVLTNKSVHTYIKTNLDVRPAGESRKQAEDNASGIEGGKSKMTKPVETQVDPHVEKKKKKAFSKKNKVETTAAENKKKKQVSEQQPVEAGSQVTPAKSKTGTSSYKDSCLLARLK
ncbi:ATP-binding cassette superfamily [Dorcoceras hygrometricum]|uniref:ATP-binding cassette superfamily n=1 Tax=Dorcoceras hygrometricum TaxID=472368 RepID=A0A2Z7BBU3_9LAMI|nr:ATP-binding cassette superfamily [Dorcoceras hygrometricum]